MKIDRLLRFGLFLLLCQSGFGQWGAYEYMRPITGVDETWHKLVLPEDIFGKTRQDLADIRIYGITPSRDTVETPYLLQATTQGETTVKVTFTMLNRSHNAKGYYYTFEVPGKDLINRMELGFGEGNFDWRVALEGSQDQREWFTLLDDYRILSIQNDQTDFRFTDLSFPESAYRYFRLLVKTSKDPGFVSAVVSHRVVQQGRFRDYPVKTMEVIKDRNSKRTQVIVDMPMAVPVARVAIEVADTTDYYRHLTVEYLVDSVRVGQVWNPRYGYLTSGVLNSLGDNTFDFGNTTLQKLRIQIDDQDNRPLRIRSVGVSGAIYELVPRFSGPADYFLVYGDPKADAPDYDIARFSDNIPDSLATLGLGAEQRILDRASSSGPLFANRMWLWGIMVVTVVLLGGFTLRMIRKS